MRAWLHRNSGELTGYLLVLAVLLFAMFT